METLRKNLPTVTPVNGSVPAYEKFSAYTSKKHFYMDNSRRVVLKFVSVAIFTTLIFSVVRNFIYIDILNKCFIGIEPGITEFNNASLVQGLSLIKEVSKEDYKKVCTTVNWMSPNPGCGGIHGGCYYENQPKKIYVNNSNRSVLYAAAIIVHEACHSAQFLEGRGGNENECYIADDQIIKKIVQF